MIDVAIVHIQAGDGGRGSNSFRREKYVARGGPDGGDGGDGGSVYLVGNTNLRTLDYFASHQEFEAESGDIGRKQKKHGRKGEDLTIKVPLGSLVYRINGLEGEQIGRDEVYKLLRDYREYSTKDISSVFDTLSQEEMPVALELLGEIVESDGQMMVSEGGQGGRGNVHFKSPSNQAPEEYEEGTPGEELWAVLELKLIADVGFFGLPNRGKSTLLSVLTAARPKIADYEFTTLEPNLGVMKVETKQQTNSKDQISKNKEQTNYSELVLSDIPGLIEGASEGKGLGDEFLRHVERCRTLVHVLAIPNYLLQSPLEDQIADLVTSYHQIRQELKAYSPELYEKSELVVLNKIDVNPEQYQEIVNKLSTELDTDILPISAATNQNIDQLKDKIVELAT